MDIEESVLNAWVEDTRERFSTNNRIKSFREFMEELAQRPYSLTRNAPQYILDMMDHFGKETKMVLDVPVTRYKLFDADFGTPRWADQPLLGQEETIHAIYEALGSLVTEGRADRMIHLHGPNGSSKSLIVELLMRGLETYSQMSEGALHSFNWVFPKGDESVRMGFGATGDSSESSGAEKADSYAHFSSDRLQVKIPCELGDHPLFLVPKHLRMRLLQKLLTDAPTDERDRFVVSYFLQDGDLCPRCRSIYDALLEEYGGNVDAVLKHVQVRRLYLSRRYRRGAVVVSPQDTPDAGSRQITLDASLQNLPRSLQHLALTQLFGDLVDANNGLIEFSDFLTRAQEFNKYLLSATERGEVALNTANLYLNLVLFATSNERHLDAFKESPDFASFKGRTILVTVPYLLERNKEQGIYDSILHRIGRRKHVAPHVARMASLFAILTRLHRPSADNYPEGLKELASGLTPVEKASLYDGELPSSNGRYTPRQLRTMRELLPLLKTEFADTPIYEGRFGASPREMREVLYNAAFQYNQKCLTPLDLFDELRDLIKDKSLYLFLQLKPEEGYHNAEKALESIEREYTTIIEREIMESMVLVPEGHYAAIFKRYFDHVKALLRGEKIEEAATGNRIEPDEEFMKMVEGYLGVEGDPKSFREELLAQVAAWTLESPDETLNLEVLFSSQLAKLAKGFAEKNSERIENIGHALLSVDSPDFETFPEADRRAAREALKSLTTRFGYCTNCALRVVDYFLHRRLHTE